MASKSRALNVFISSTFKDMQREREILTRIVFPRLRERFGDRGQLFDHDLRWGITATMAADGGAVGACLENVGSCAPFVLGMIGERMGWQPEFALLERFDPMFARTVPPDTALTEWELRFSVHCRPHGAPPIPVLVRSAALSASLGFGVDPQDERALSALRGWIGASPAIAAYAYDSFEAFETLAEEALAQLVCGWDMPLAGPRDTGTPRIDRGDAVRQIDRHCRWGRPTVAWSAPGAGASSIIGDWLAQQEGTHHFLDGRTGSLVEIAAAVGSPAASDAAEALGSDPVGEGLAIVALTTAIERIGARRERTTIVIDHYEEAAASPDGADLTWLPKRLPRHLRLLIVTHDERLFLRAKASKVATVTIAAPPVAAIARYAIAYLARYSKVLDPQDSVRIAAAAWGANLHVAHVALDELRRHGAFDTLHEQTVRVTGAATAGSLVDLVLDGIVAALPDPWRETARDTLIILALSLRGLGRDEIELVLLRVSSESASGDPATALPAHIFGAVRLALAPFLAQHDDLLDVRHAALGDWLAHPAQRLRRTRLGEVFGDSLDRFAPERARTERPSLAYHAGGEAGLAALLADPAAAGATLAEGPVFFEGWLALLGAQALRDVFDGWAASPHFAALAPSTRLALAEVAVRFGEPTRAGALLRDGDRAAALSPALALQTALITRDRPAFEAMAKGVAAGGSGWAALLLAGIAAGTYDPPAERADAILKAAEAASSASPLAQAQVQLFAGQVMIARARWKASLVHFTAAEALARRAGASSVLCRALERRSAVLIEAHRFSQARRAADECRGLAERLGLARYEALAFERLIEIEQRRANWTQAYRLSTAYLDRMRSAGGDVPRAIQAIESIEPSR